MRRLAVLLLVALPLLPGRADALTLKEIVELHRSGLSDDVLVALIDVNRIIYSLDAGTMKDLKTDGLSDRVLIAIINSGRQHLPQAAAAAAPATESVPVAAPQVVVIEHPVPAPAAQIIVQHVPVYVPVPITSGRSRSARVEPVATPPSPYYVGQVRPPEPRQAPEPVYWGFGGKLRPDAWQPAGKKPTGDRRQESGDSRQGDSCSS
jgi:hypothetical protein